MTELCIRALPDQDENLRALAERRWAEARVREPALPETHPLVALLGISDFLAETLAGQTGLVLELIASGDLDRPERRAAEAATLSAAVSDCASETELHALLRRHRRRAMTVIAARDLWGQASLEESLTHLTALADACIDQALSWLHARQCAEQGIPSSFAGEPQELVVLAMGKLGAGELNFSSDIDLIFAYPELGETVGGPRSVATDAYFTRLGQRLIAALDKSTAEGFVFRVDMRLRPYGDSGPLVMCYDALEDYYQDQGREWERYAMIKARPVTGSEAARARLLALLKPFVFRRYIDFSVMASLREMKAMISREMRRKGLTDNLKLGPGGIREIEFIAQVFQLIRGGRDSELQTRSLLAVLPLLGERGLVEPAAVGELLTAYRFLRKAEHALQELADQQTQTLPGDGPTRLRLATALGYARWDGFHAALDAHRERVEAQFRVLIGEPAENGEEASEHLALRAVWEASLEGEEARAVLAEAGFPEPEAALAQLTALREGAYRRVLGERGQARLDGLMPPLLAAIGEGAEPMACLQRVLALIEGIGRRTAYLELLAENPGARRHLLRLLALSPWIAERLRQYPILLDELLDARSLYAPASRAQLADQWRQTRLRLAPEDEEQHMDALREFRHAQALRIAAAELCGELPAEAASRHLSELAEVIVRAVLDEAWAGLVRRHGAPPGCDAAAPGFAVIAYGKFGGAELGYGSDLDLVFLHSGEPQALTEGAKPVSLAQFYARLGQRLVHWLATRTGAGLLYETDTRLRPSGNSGLLVAELSSFADYQAREAWTWEHQALVRARGLAGDPAVCAGFEAVRADILTRPREPVQLADDVRSMRRRMREHLAREEAGVFDLKQDRGGLVDIEFLAQWGVLERAAEAPELLASRNTAEILRRLEGCGFLEPGTGTALAEDYAELRALSHAAALQNRPARAPAEACTELRERVTQICARLYQEA
ncbi:MAG: bifunctional [glutamate--ammonia ligase]-adenylyl-L-tyrosine phosphorylase/[glutamate--ammonia-ligase] adenylyltransferase [Gammaproteobacteria bacterium]|nr:bifunctional [glutamate--ammonia ligase]-adenylyl-L-tyrosine phosphorylase/[glutamate--ammonia-ligase] adenylyltransferase [Gammaproteobacteria bacterium]